MTELQIKSSVTGHRSDSYRMLWACTVVALLVSTIATMVAMSAMDDAAQAQHRARRADMELHLIAPSVNAANSSLRTRIDRNLADLDVCHERATLLAAAIDAVAKTCPKRWRSPRFVGEQAALMRPERMQ